MCRLTIPADLMPLEAHITLPSLATLRALPIGEREQRIDDVLIEARTAIEEAVEAEDAPADLRLIPA